MIFFERVEYSWGDLQFEQSNVYVFVRFLRLRYIYIDRHFLSNTNLLIPPSYLSNNH